MKAVFAALCSLLLFASVSAAEVRTAEDFVWYRVHFGMGIGNQSLSPDILREFVAKEVTARFPEGLTITVSRGQWKSSTVGMIQEHTTVVDIQCPDTPENWEKIEQIGTAYAERFKKAKASMFVMRIQGIQTTLWY